MTSSVVGTERSTVVPSAPGAAGPLTAKRWITTLAAWRERHWSMLAAAIALAVTMAAFQPLPVGVWVDDGHYVVLARALATGQGYRYLNPPGALRDSLSTGVPGVLAILTRLVPAFPTNVRVFVFSNALLTAAAAACIVVVGYRRLSLPLPVATLAAVTWAIAVPTLMLSTAVMSEPLFLAMLLPTLLVAERAARDGGARWTAAAGLMLAACILVRSIGIAGFGAFAVVLATRRRWRELGLALVTTAAAVAPWLVWKRLHETPLPMAWAGMYGDYGAWLSEGVSSHGVTLLLRVALQNARDVVEAFAAYWSAGPGGVFRTSLAVMLLIVMCVGLAISWRRAPVIAWTLVCYMAIVLVWPFHPQRFVWGIGAVWIPLCCAGAWRIWQSIRVRVASKPKRAVAAAALTALALGLPIGSILAVRTRAWNRVPRSGAETLVPLLQWIVRNTPPDAVIAADAETVIYLYTGRRAIPFVPFKAADRVGLRPQTRLTPDSRRCCACTIRVGPRLGVLTLRVALHFTTHEGAPPA
jgi:hypothetical protein